MATTCELLSTCIFFNDKMSHMPVTAELMKQQYCRGDYVKCCRYQVYKSLGRDGVPGDLLPSSTERCQSILTHH